MEDSQIVELFWKRDEAALAEAESKYGQYCRSIAGNILHDTQDAQECVNDVYMRAWNAIPPARPVKLAAYLAKITRHLALNRRRDASADKRGGGNVDASLSELEECIPSNADVDEALDAHEVTTVLNAFLRTLPRDELHVFIRRYWFFDSISDISKRYGFGESKVKMMLKRARDKLATRLRKEGVWT